MKARVITTRKILVATVAAAASAGCSQPAVEITPATAEAVPTAPEVAIVPATVPEPSPPRPEPPPAPPPSQEAPRADQERDRLVGELISLTETQALADLQRFRPLCDDNGFPLVGNVARKGPVETQPSELCGLVRARLLK